MMHECNFRPPQPWRCPCETVECPECGVRHKVKWCPEHDALRGKMAGRAWFEAMGCFEANTGIPLNQEAIRVFNWAINALSIHRDALAGKVVCEIGSGIGRLWPSLLAAGCQRIIGVDPDQWAARYTAMAYPCRTMTLPFNDSTLPKDMADVVLSQHTLEHVPDAPASFARWYAAASERMLLTLPDGTDIGNPDHAWFFGPDTIANWAHSLGAKSVATVVYDNGEGKEKDLWTLITK